MSFDKSVVRLTPPTVPILVERRVALLVPVSAARRVAVAGSARARLTLRMPVTRLVVGGAPPGPPGPVGAPMEMVWRETPSGALNGINVIFTLAQTPMAQSETVVLNGVTLEDGAGADYTISGTTLTMAVAPQAGDRLLVSYQPQ